MSEQGIFINPDGISSTVLMEHVRDLTGRRIVEGESQTSIVRATFNENKSGQYILKEALGPQFLEGKYDWRPISIIEKWKELNADGVNVVPEIYLDESKNRLLFSDVTNGGHLEFLDLGELMQMISGDRGTTWENFGEGGSVSFLWVKENKSEIFRQVFENLEKASEAGFEVYMDSFFCTRDPSSKELTVYLADLGQGVLKHGDNVDRQALKRHNVGINVKRVLLSKKVYTQEEFDREFSQYTNIKV